MGFIPLERTHTDNMVVVAQLVALAIGTCGDALEANILQAHQFAGLADAIAIQVTPDTQLAERRILHIQLAILVDIQLTQGLEAVGGLASIGQTAVLAKQLQATVDSAIAITIPDQQAIIAFDPARAFADAVVGMVE
ncbi:hypothetical protein D9M71_663760 [compost metagenome]